jgi:hypothetical protein
MGEMRNAYRILVGNSEGKKTLNRCGWEDKIKMYLKETGL